MHAKRQCNVHSRHMAVRAGCVSLTSRLTVEVLPRGRARGKSDITAPEVQPLNL